MAKKQTPNFDSFFEEENKSTISPNKNNDRIEVIDAVINNPIASSKRKINDYENENPQENLNDIPKKIKFINDDIDLSVRKTSFLNLDNHKKVKVLSDLYGIPMSTLENNIVKFFFDKYKDLLNDELNKNKYEY